MNNYHYEPEWLKNLVLWCAIAFGLLNFVVVPAAILIKVFLL